MNSETKSQNDFKKTANDKLDKIVVGQKDRFGNNILKVFIRGEEFAIYEIKTENISDSIRIAIEPWTENDANGREDNFHEISSKFIEIKGLLYKVPDDPAYKSRIANTLELGIQGKTEEANSDFNDLIEEINDIYKERSRNRLKYLSTVLSIVLIQIIFSFVVYYNDLFLDKPIIRNLIYVATSGAIGGFISVSRRLRAMYFEKGVDWYLYIFYGIERLLISTFGAVIIYFAISCNLVFGIVNEIGNPIFGTLVFSFVAGFSETLIPNLLIKLERENV